MNIVIITSHYPTRDPNCKLSLADHYYAREWIEQGHNVIVFHISAELFNFANCRTFEKYYIETVKVFHAKYLRIIPKHNKTEAISTHLICKKILETLDYVSYKIDLFYCDFCAGNWDVIRRLKKKYQYREALFVPVFNNCDFYNRGRAKRIIEESKIVCVRSKDQARRVKQISSSSNPIIAYSGAPISKKDIRDIISKKIEGNLTYSIIYAGDLIPLKNVDILLKSIAEVSKVYPVSCTIVGDGPMEQELKSLSKELGIESKVFFTGRVSRLEVLKYMEKADMFVMASSPESYGIVYLEAMSKGCYVIASKNEGIDGVVVDDKNGALVSSRDVDGLKNAIMSFYSVSPSVRRGWLSESYRTANEYSESNVAKRILQEIMQESRIINAKEV